MLCQSYLGTVQNADHINIFTFRFEGILDAFGDIILSKLHESGLAELICQNKDANRVSVLDGCVIWVQVLQERLEGAMARVRDTDLNEAWYGISLWHVSWWRHQMETFSRYWPFVRGIHRSLVNSPHKGQWRGALMFSFICVWINGWVNNREAGNLRCYRAHYDVIVMLLRPGLLVPLSWTLIFNWIHCKLLQDLKFHLRVSNLQTNCRVLTRREGTKISFPSNGCRHVPLLWYLGLLTDT